ncbi:hypothetical protein KI387_025351, partial [Taxus chinensis]
EVIGTFGLSLSDLSTKITKLILATLGLDAETFYESDFEKCKPTLCISGYSSHGKCEGEEALPSHADAGCVTILYNDETQGLEVRSKQGKWFSVEHAPDSFAVMLGDSLK